MWVFFSFGNKDMSPAQIKTWKCLAPILARFADVDERRFSKRVNALKSTPLHEKQTLSLISSKPSVVRVDLGAQVPAQTPDRCSRFLLEPKFWEKLASSKPKYRVKNSVPFFRKSGYQTKRLITNNRTNRKKLSFTFSENLIFLWWK